MISRRLFRVGEWNYVHLSRKKLDYPHLKDFLKYEHELHLKQLLTSPQCKIFDAYRTLNPRLATYIIDGGRLSLSLEIIDYATFALMM